jgi:hypothetical protein
VFRCSGCGYDKTSTVVAEAFNQYLLYKLWAMTAEQIKGGHGSGTLEPNVARDTYFFLRVTKIERQYYKVGSVSSGVWSPGAKSAQGSAVTLFQAAATPWGTS